MMFIHENNFRQLGLAVVCSIGFCSSAHCQIVAQSEDNDTRETISQLSSGGPVGSADHAFGLGYGDIVPTAQLSSLDGSVTAEFALDGAFAGAPTEKVVNEVNYISGSFTNFSAKLKLPLNKAENDAPISFKEIGNKAAFSFSLNHFSPNTPSPIGRHEYVVRFARSCITDAGARWIRNAVPPIPVDQQDQVTKLIALYDSFSPTEGWDDAITKAAANAAVANFGPVAISECVVSDVNIIERKFAKTTLSASEYRDWVRGYSRPSKTLFIGMQSSIGYDIHSVIDRTQFRLTKEKRVGFDAEAFVGWILNGGNSSVRAGGGFTRSFETQAEAAVCGPPNASGQSTCINGQDGKPTKKETGYGTIGFRHILLRNKEALPVLAIAPSVTYLLKEKDFEVRLPLYLQRSKEGGLDAGVQTIFRTGKNDFSVGAFIGVPFDLFAR